jgi:retron-type reverse transcriptase
MTHQEIYDEIKKTSKDRYILEEIKRLGFWDSLKPEIAKKLIENKIKLRDSLINIDTIKDAKNLSDRMGISLKSLEFLTYTQKLSPINHYTHFKIVKKSGGFREISAPKPQLKRLQHWILENILNKIAINDKAHGFANRRSIITNAIPHIKKSVVINCDLENFFPTIGYPRVKGMFKSFGYSDEVANILAILTTEAKTEEILLNGKKLYIYRGKRYLPQGSPASPTITNLICRKLDSRMIGVAKSLGFVYSRYADDMTFSSNEYKNINKMMYWIRDITKKEGFILHPKKTKIMKKGSRHEVTGIVVNEKLSINRKELKRFRALLYQIKKSGIEGKSWNGKSKNLMASIFGYANFIKMVDNKKGKIYMAEVKEILRKYPIK